MNKYIEQEKRLNKYAVPLSFHDFDLMNLEFHDDSIKMRFNIMKYMENCNILENDNQLAILDVIYKGINIKEMNLKGFMDFKDCEVLTFDEEDNNVIYLLVYNDDYNNYFSMRFTYKDYHWSVNDVITLDEFDDELGWFDEIEDSIDKLINCKISRIYNFEEDK